MKCPNCGSENTILESNKIYVCKECKKKFSKPVFSEVLQIFLSYGHDPHKEYLNAFAYSLYKKIKKLNYICYIDVDIIKVANDWEELLEKSLDNVCSDKTTGRLILLMTEHSVRRPNGYCLNELAKAVANDIKIIPIMIERVEPPLSIYRLQYIDYCGKISDTKNELNDKDFERIINVLNTPDLLSQEGEYQKLIKSLRPLIFDADIKMHINQFIGRKWVFEKVKEWINNENAPKIFWMTALPGVGKSAIAINLLHEFPNIVAFHMCKRGSEERSSPIRAICSIAYQLSNYNTQYREFLVKSADMIKEFQNNNGNVIDFFSNLVIQPLCGICHIGKISPLIILIDGLDENTQDGENYMAQFINDAIELFPKWLRIVVTSRPDPEIRFFLQGISQEWNLSTMKIESTLDMDKYIDNILFNFKDNPKYNEVKKAIVDNADGIFLYVKYICSEISSGTLLFEKHKEFPNSIGSIYSKYFKNQFPNIQYYRKNILPILQLMGASFEVLTKKDVMSILDWSNDQIDMFVSEMRSLVIVNTEDQLIPFHATLFEWLKDKNKSWKYFINESDGDLLFVNFLNNNAIGNHNTPLYIYQYILYHYLRLAKKESCVGGNICYYDDIIKLMNYQKFFCFVFKNLGSDLACSVLFRTLKVLSERKIVNKLFSSNDFLMLIYEIRTILMHKSHFNNLKKLGFDITNKIDDYRDNDKALVVLLNFLYNNAEYLKIHENIDIYKQIIEDRGMVYDLLALSEKMIGNINSALELFAKSKEYFKKENRNIDNVYIYVNIARIEVLKCEFDKAKSTWRDANHIFEREVHISNINEFDIRQLKIALGHVKLDIELFSPSPDLDACNEVIEWFDSVYSHEITRDRYYVRHTHLSILYFIIIGRGDIAEEKIQLSRQSINTVYDKIKQDYYEIFLDYILEKQDIDKARIDELLSICKDISAIEYTEICALSTVIGYKKDLLPAHIHLSQRKKYLENYFKLIKSNFVYLQSNPKYITTKSSRVNT